MLNLCKLSGALLLSAPLFCQAQNQVPGAPIYYNTTNGYVQTGTNTTPAAPLSVTAAGNNANYSNQLVALFQNTNFNSGNASGEAKLCIGFANHYAAGISAYKETVNTDGLRFYTEYGFNSPRLAMYINPLGNISVGAALSQNTQTISFPGNYNFESLNLGQTANGNSFIEFVNHNGVSTSYGIKTGANIDTYGAGFYIATAGSASSYSSLSYNTTPAFMVTGQSVCVNTNNPQGYSLAVNGPAIFTQATVKNYANWPDYVFGPDYRPMDIDSLQQYLAQNHHLPGVPTKEEVAQNGMDLGEMNKLLLKKIEELTLYMEDAHRQLAAQQLEIEDLKRQIQKHP